MYKRVDIDDDKLDGFEYRNKDNETEYVHLRLSDGVIDIEDSGNDVVSIYIEDIPKLIKALKETEAYLRHNGGT